MKKPIKSLSILLILIVVLVLSSCDIFIGNISDHDTADQNMDLLIKCLKNEDIDELKKLCSDNMKSTETFEEDVKELFAPNIVEKDINFDDDLKSLISYYKETYQNIQKAYGLNSTGPIENGKRIKLIRTSFDITTTEEEYRISFDWRIRDDFDENNIGIWSLHIITVVDVPLYQCGGDGSWTEGITIDSNK